MHPDNQYSFADERLEGIDEWNPNEFKEELNNFIIMHGPPNITIRRAEEIMIDFIEQLAKADS